MELPPRTRRILGGGFRSPPLVRTTSAHAENTIIYRQSPRGTTNYLRARGEYSLEEGKRWRGIR